MCGFDSHPVHQTNTVAPSSKGRIADFESADCGSNRVRASKTLLGGSLIGRAADFESVGCRFESCPPSQIHAPVSPLATNEVKGNWITWRFESSPALQIPLPVRLSGRTRYSEYRKRGSNPRRASYRPSVINNCGRRASTT